MTETSPAQPAVEQPRAVRRPGTVRPTTAGQPKRPRITSLEVFCLLLLLAIMLNGPLARMLDQPGIRTGATVFVAVTVQAFPFLLLGVLISGLISAFLPPSVLNRVLPKRENVTVPIAGLAGLALPSCECASVPVARRLMQQGVAPSAAIAFLLAAPAINPIVLVATAVAFQGEPRMVVARFVGSLATAMVMGWLWARFGRLEWIVERARTRVERRTGESRLATFAESARHDLADAGGFLVLGALATAVLNVVVPASVFDSIGGQVAVAVIVMALLAVVLALCSEADAFIAASLPGLPLLAKLVFLVVGPAVDVKLIALQAGTFGRGFAARFAPATFVVAVACAVLAGILVLGGVR